MLFRSVEAKGKLTLAVTQAALKLEGIDDRGLDEQDRAYLRTLITVYDGGTAGVEAIAIGYMHAYLDGKHERRTRDILSELLPGVSITLSSEVSRVCRSRDAVAANKCNCRNDFRDRESTLRNLRAFGKL